MYFKLKFFLGNIWWFEGQNVNDLQFKIYICIEGDNLDWGLLSQVSGVIVKKVRS